MKALILNSGMGRRMGELTSQHPKCMTLLNENETIISRQLWMLNELGILDVVITTGKFSDVLESYVKELNLNLNIRYVYNSLYYKTNYIYSMYLASEFLKDDILLMHGDLVFEQDVLNRVVNSQKSCMVVSSTVDLPKKDFKAVVENDIIKKIGVNFFDKSLTAQPLYKFTREEWLYWMQNITLYCEKGIVDCYAEDAFNTISHKCNLHPEDIKEMLCNEIDTFEDLEKIRRMLA